VTLHYTGYERTVVTSVLPNSHLKRVTIPDAVLIQLPSWRWVQQCSKRVEKFNKCIKIKNLCIKLVKKNTIQRGIYCHSATSSTTNIKHRPGIEPGVRDRPLIVSALRWTRIRSQEMYVWRNTEPRSYNQFWCGEAVLHILHVCLQS